MPSPSSRFVPPAVAFHLFLSVLPALALERASPPEVGLSPERLDRITAYLWSEVEAGHFAGAVALVARHGRIAYLEAAGSMDLESRTPMTSGTLFRIASMTKAVTSAAVLMLVDEGLLRLADPVSRYLPEFREPEVLAAGTNGEALATVQAQREITVHDLLAHTSGITYGLSGPAALDQLYQEAGVTGVFVPAAGTTEDFTGALAKLPLKFQPGSGWDYGLGIDALGRLVEVVSGLRFDQFCRERIFRPLGMRDTHFFVPESKRDRLASLYTPGADGALRKVTSEPVTAGGWTFTADFCTAGAGRFVSGGGGLVSTATDYARFLQMLLGGGEHAGRRLLERDTVARMTAHQIGGFRVPFPGHGDGFGYGFGVLTESGLAADVASAGTYSWGGLFHTYFWVDPQEELIGILMTQVFPFWHLATRDEFKRLAYAAIDDSGFYRLVWYEKGVEHGNPHFNRRQLRINGPASSVHPQFSRRSEVRSSGLARIRIEEDLRAVRRADLYCEIWGGHPGTAAKRVSVNGRSLYPIPEVGTVAGHATHQYPRVCLRITDLVNGYNSLQFACDDGTAFWGHYIADNACLRIGLPRSHGSLVEAGLAGFDVRVEADPDPGGETILLRLAGDREDFDAVGEVHYQGLYLGYDENGDGRSLDWHGMTKTRRPYGMIGSSREAPFEVRWDTRLLPALERVAVRAIAIPREQPELEYVTPPLRGLEIPERARSLVSLHSASDLPAPFWSRAGRRVECTIALDAGPETIEAAELHVVTWTGGAGTVREYFRLNGHHLPVAEGDGHEVVYSRLELDPAILRRGANRVELLSDTEHHGIEVLRPGPALAVRVRVE